MGKLQERKDVMMVIQNLVIDVQLNVLLRAALIVEME
jgi:hypothetical protein